jgi:hypothetical protein
MDFFLGIKSDYWPFLISSAVFVKPKVLLFCNFIRIGLINLALIGNKNPKITHQTR